MRKILFISVVLSLAIFARASAAEVSLQTEDEKYGLIEAYEPDYGDLGKGMMPKTGVKWEKIDWNFLIWPLILLGLVGFWFFSPTKSYKKSKNHEKNS